MNNFLIRYAVGDSFLERLSGKTKVLLFFSSITLMMATFDLRIILPLFIVQCVLLKGVYRQERAIVFVVRFVVVMNLINLLLFYAVNPITGTDLTGTVTELFRFNDFYLVTYETLIYFVTRLLKIFGTLVISLWFVLSITPSQLAAGLYQLGVPYKICTMLSLGLRYIPDVHRDYMDIKESMQMRGLELDAKKASLWTRLKANVSILVPLLLVSFEKVDVIASAMDLRGYGQQKKRSYYSEQEVTRDDKKIQLLAFVQFVILGVYLVLFFMGLAPKLWLP